MPDWRHFRIEEFACRCGCGANFIEPTFVAKLDELRDRAGFPLVVTSGYRCPKHNREVSHTGDGGPHTTGRAVDLAIDRGRCYRVLELALPMGFTGIGVQQRGASRFLHLDDLMAGPGQPRPTVWSY